MSVPPKPSPDDQVANDLWWIQGGGCFFDQERYDAIKERFPKEYAQWEDDMKTGDALGAFIRRYHENNDKESNSYMAL